MTEANDPLASIEFADNPDQRCACVLVLDISGSMAGEKISELNDGLRAFEESLKDDDLAMKRVEICIVTFGGPRGGVEVAQDFVVAKDFIAPTLGTGGTTPMGAAIVKSLDLIADRKAVYKANGIPYYRPWVVLITDGAPTDSWKRAAERVRQEESSGGATFFAVGVAGADTQVLSQIAVREPLILRGLAFRELFMWLSASQKQVSGSRIGEQVALPAVNWNVV